MFNYLMLVLMVAGPLAVAGGSLIRDVGNSTNCTAVFEIHGVSERFPGAVAHGIHSMTVEALRSFRPDVTEVNYVPTVNRNLTDSSPILRNAPELHLRNQFMTPAMQVVDEVLSHMDDPLYDVKAYTPLEKLVHGLHMEEVWSMARMKYQALVGSPVPPTADLCSCVMDVESNGVLTMLRFIALQLREPELMYGRHVTINGKSYKWDANVYSYGFAPMSDESNLLRKPKDAIPSLKSAAAWASWKKVMESMLPEDDETLGLFLFCALEKNGQD